MTKFIFSILLLIGLNQPAVAQPKGAPVCPTSVVDHNQIEGGHEADGAQAFQFVQQDAG